MDFIDVLINQRSAVEGHDTWKDLQRIKAPTLIITGNEDMLIPPENSRILAEKIPNARIQFIEEGGHQFLVEQPDISNQIILEFLQGISEK